MLHRIASDKLQAPPPGGSRWQKITSVALACVVTTVALYFGPQLVRTLASVDRGWALAGLFCYAANYLMRAGRFSVLSNGRVRPWPEGLYASSLHGFATYMLPFRSGELMLPVLLRKVAGLTLLEGASILINARLLDVMILGFCIMAVILTCKIPLSFELLVAWFILGFALTAAAIAVRMGLGVRWVQRRWPRSASLFAGIRKFGMPEVLLSLGIWIAVAGCFFCTAQSLNLPLGMGEIWLLISIQLPLQLIPVQGMANAGNHEAGWLTGLALLGISASRAVEFALASHVLLLGYVLLLGPIGLIAGYFHSAKA